MCDQETSNEEAKARYGAVKNTTRRVNNNNKLQLGYHPVAVFILHVHKYEKKVTTNFKSGGLHERYVVGTSRKQKLGACGQTTDTRQH